MFSSLDWALLGAQPVSSFCLYWMTPDLILLLSLLQTSADIPQTETPASTLPPTPMPLVMTTTVTIGRNVTVLEVSGKWTGLEGKALGTGGGRQ